MCSDDVDEQSVSYYAEAGRGQRVGTKALARLWSGKILFK